MTHDLVQDDQPGGCGCDWRVSEPSCCRSAASNNMAPSAQRHRHDGRRTRSARGRRAPRRGVRPVLSVRCHADPRGPSRLGDATPRDVRGRCSTDVCTELIAAGAQTVVLVNWHEGNIASMNAVATDLQDRLRRHVRGRAGLLHGAATLSGGGRRTHPRRRDRDSGGVRLRRDAWSRPSAPVSRPGPRARTRWTDAALARGLRVHHRCHRTRHDGWYGNPRWATVDRAKDFTDVVASGVLAGIEAVMSARRARSPPTQVNEGDIE